MHGANMKKQVESTGKRFEAQTLSE
jgi:hypothetical protein